MKSQGINVLIEDHKRILQLVEGIKYFCIQGIKDQAIDIEDVKDIVVFIQEFADHHHHAVEEDILFYYLEKEFGEVGEKLTRHGMIIEHEYARRIVLDLEERIHEYETNKEKKNSLSELVEIIGLLMSYKNHLEHHIHKEDMAIFIFADKHLSEESLKEIDEKIQEYLKEYGEEKEELATGILSFYNKYYKE